MSKGEKIGLWVGGIIALIVIIFAIIRNAGKNNSSASTNLNQIPLSQVKNSAITIDYDNLMRYNGDYVGKIIYYRGQILQIVENHQGCYDIRLATKKSTYLENYYEDVLWLNYYGKLFLESDFIDMGGSVEGIKKYNTVLGSRQMIPEINARYIELIK